MEVGLPQVRVWRECVKATETTDSITSRWVPRGTRRRHRFLTHSIKQWDAVRIHLSLMRLPPQRCSPWYWRLTCHGQSPRWAFTPPAIRVMGLGKPQVGAGRKCKQKED